MSRCIPEGPLKVFVRDVLLTYKATIPREFFLNKGDIATLVGSPNRKSIERMSKIVGNCGKVILIEPNQKNVETHYAHISLHKLGNVTIVPKAAYNEKGQAKFLIAAESGDHRLVILQITHDNDYRNENYYIKEIEVEVHTMDNIINALNIMRLDYVKIMVNGAEIHVLQGMVKMLGVTQRLFIKGHARYIETNQPLYENIIPFLKKRGFHTRLTLPSKSVAMTIDWKEREGDVFAWRSADSIL